MTARNYAVLLMAFFSACKPRTEPPDPTSHVVPLVVEDAAAPTPAPIEASVAGMPCGPGMQTDPMELDKAPCNTNADCVLTDVPQQCNACNTKSLYPALKKQVDTRMAYCAESSCATCCIPQRCTPHDNAYSPAFYRAECRTGKCVLFRWHSGG